jgi:hypothetical protein
VASISAAGFVCGLLVVTLAIGNATLLARGDIANSIAVIVGVVLFAAVILLAGFCWLADLKRSSGTLWTSSISPRWPSPWGR